MVIVLIKWKIKSGCCNAFLDFWRHEAIVQDRRGLVGEFLSEIGSKEDCPWITWNLDDEDDASEVSHLFVNVGLWADPDAFRSQIAQYFNDERPPREFEAERRVRTVLEPKCWRMGDASLPLHDSGGVL